MNPLGAGVPCGGTKISDAVAESLSKHKDRRDRNGHIDVYDALRILDR